MHHPHGDEYRWCNGSNKKELLIDCQGNWGNILTVMVQRLQDILKLVF
jgi:hypothetical protein